MTSVITCSNTEILFSNHTKINLVYTRDKIDNFILRKSKNMRSCIARVTDNNR